MKHSLRVSLLLLLAFPALRAENWNVLSGDWGTAANWNPASVPTTGDAFVANNGSATITGGSLTAANLWIGNGGGGGAAGTVVQNGGTLTPTGNVHVGNDDRNGVYTLANGALNGTGRTLSISRGGGSATSTGTFNLTGGAGTFAAINLGSDGLASRVRLAHLNVQGGVLTNTGGMNIGNSDSARGTVTVANGTFTNSGQVNLGNAANARGSVILNSGSMTTGNLDIGNNTTGQGTVTVNGGSLGISGYGNIGGAGPGSLLIHGGTVTPTGSWFEVGVGATGSGSTLLVDGGTLNRTSGSMIIAARSAGTGTVSGTGSLLVGGNLVLGGGNDASTATGVLNVQAGGLVQSNILEVGRGTGTGILNLEGGTYRVTTINNLVGGGSQFNWGDGALTMRQSDAGTLTGADLSSGTGFTQVRNSTTTFTSNANVTTGNGANAASRLDMGGIYLAGGSVLFDHFTVGAGRNLNLASNADILEFNDDNVYLLRPFGFSTEDYGSLPLVTTTGGSTITGSFDNFLGLGDDGRGFTQYTGAFTSAALLPVNSWYLEQTGSAITFHYKVQGTVPEPGTLGLAALGTYMLRLARRRHR